MKSRPRRFVRFSVFRAHGSLLCNWRQPPFSSPDDHQVRQIDEEAVFDHAGKGVYPAFGADGVVDSAGEVAVQDQVAVVGFIGSSGVGVPAQLGSQALIHEVVADEGAGEGDYLHRQGGSGAEPRHHLGGVDDYDQLFAGARDDFLAQQGTAQTLDEIEPWIDLVGAVDGQIDRQAALQIEDFDVQLPGEAGRGLGCGYGADAQALRHAPPQGPDGVFGGRAGSQAHHHAVGDVFDSLGSGRFLRVHGLFHGSAIRSGMVGGFNQFEAAARDSISNRPGAVAGGRRCSSSSARCRAAAILGVRTWR